MDEHRRRMQDGIIAGEIRPEKRNLVDAAGADARVPQGKDGKIGLPVDASRLREFDVILERYKSGKHSVERRVVSAEQWWKLRNEAEERKNGVGWNDDFHAKSGWLHNVIVSKHADAMDSYPEPMVLPREPGDKETAKTLSDVLPVILEQNKFEKTYSDAVWQKLKTGTGVYKVTWDQDLHNGLGDISIINVDLLGVFWEPGVTDIQKSRYFFHCELQDDELLEQQYPELKDKLKGEKTTLTRFIYDDNVSTEGKSLVIDVYYKVKDGARTVLHYCKYVNDVILVSTENDQAAGADMTGAEADESMMLPETEHVGLYDHGLYPFVFDPLFPVEGSPCGYGFVDLCMNTQMQIDMLDTAFLKNAMVGATPRYFERVDGAVNEAEFKNINNAIVHVNGPLDDTGLRPIDYSPLAGNYISFYQNKVNELRETSGNTETAAGTANAGVTAASAIAALQEASGKGSRDSTRASYRCFSEVVNLCVELIRQFYDLPRFFRITGDNGQQDFTMLDNSQLQPQPIGLGNESLGFRTPVFDIKVEVQKRNAYTRQSQNDLALQLYNLGFFNPQLATPALSCIEMMDFEGKEDLTQRIAQNGTIFDQLQQMAQLALALTQKYEPENVDGLVAALQGTQTLAGGGGMIQQPDVTGEDRRMQKTRSRTANAPSPSR